MPALAPGASAGSGFGRGPAAPHRTPAPRSTRGLSGSRCV